MDSPDPQKIVYQERVKINSNENLKLMADELRDSLGIPGWSLFWLTSRDSLGVFHTGYQNPKANYQITYYPESSTVQIVKINYGFWRIVNTLHGFAGRMPNGPFLRIWGVYTYFCVFIVLFSLISGIWLWAKKKVEKRVGWITVSGIMIFSLLLIFLAYFHG